MASQQGTYLARLFSRGFEFSASVPQKTSPSGAADGSEGVPSEGEEPEDVPLSEKLGLSVVKGKFAKPFQFLNLGILAYTGADGALAQVQVRANIGLGWVGLGWVGLGGVGLTSDAVGYALGFSGSAVRCR